MMGDFSCEICGKKFSTDSGLEKHSDNLEGSVLHDYGKLKRLYHDEGLTQSEIADCIGTNAPKVNEYMQLHGIEARDRSEISKGIWRNKPAWFGTDVHGYESWQTNPDGERLSVKVHRLLAVSEYGFESVKDMDVHHKIDIPWLNTPDNIGLMDHVKHGRMHAHDQHGNTRFGDMEPSISEIDEQSNEATKDDFK